MKRLRSRSSALGTIACVSVAAFTPLLSAVVHAQSAPSVAPANTAPYLLQMWISALQAPRPGGVLAGGVGPLVPQSELDLNGSGLLGSYQPGGATLTANNAFFQSLGTNGRTCVTCHQPSSAMSVSGVDISLRYFLTAGTDPLFAPVDGANCPSAVPAANTAKSYLGGHLGSGLTMLQAHSLILTRGVFRIFLPVPANAEFTVSVVSDPNGCNTNPTYAQVTDPTTGATSQIISVYRRPLLATNLKYVMNVGPSFGGPPPPTDPFTGLPESGNIMWDGREATLESQAIDATLGHAQALQAPSTTQVAQIVAFENGFLSAQQTDLLAGNLAANGVTGGALNLATTPAGVSAGFGGPAPTFTLFNAWSTVSGTSLSAQRQASIYRGQEIFNNRTFSVANVPGFTGPRGPVGSCTLCHGEVNAGSDFKAGGQHVLGVGGDAAQIGGPAPATDLPIFQVTCKNGAVNPYGGTTTLTNDPGRALITGKCADIAAFTAPPLRALASHAPYFHDGSAATMLDVVNFYNNRFSMGLSAQDKADLVNFLNAL